MSDNSGFWMTVGLSGAAGLFAGVGTAITFGPDSRSKVKSDIDSYVGGKRRRTRRAKRHA